VKEAEIQSCINVAVLGRVRDDWMQYLHSVTSRTF